MPITTLEEAFHSIETIREAVPFEAIDFLRNHEANQQITEKIVFSLSNAYNEAVYTYKAGNDAIPLWYTIVAAKHISPELVQPLIGVHKTLFATSLQLLIPNS